MFFSGISDESGASIDQQIHAHKELGWTHLELRLIDGVNLTAIPDEKFGEVYDKVTAAGMTVSCFASGIGNWACNITADHNIDIEDLKRAIPRMNKFGTPFIRVMSYPNVKDHPLTERAWRTEAIRRMKVLVEIAEDGGVTLVHENCSGWGGLSADNSNILLGEVDSPALKVVFDTGNPVTYRQNAWDYYKAVLKDIVYVHIKDAKIVDNKNVYTFCGEGEAYVREIVADLLKRGYDSGFSIEPHVAAVIHSGQQAVDPVWLHDSYIEYGRRLMKIVEETKPADVRKS